VPALATLAWRPVGSYLCEAVGFQDCCGPTLEARDGTFTGAASAPAMGTMARHQLRTYGKDQRGALCQRHKQLNGSSQMASGAGQPAGDRAPLRGPRGLSRLVACTDVVRRRAFGRPGGIRPRGLALLLRPG